MNFEEKLREKIKVSEFRSPERDILRVVLGEIQRKTVGRQLKDEEGYTVVKQMIAANEEVLGKLEASDLRRGGFESENRILGSLLPAYWSEDQIHNELQKLDLASAQNVGKAIGMAMSHLKTLNAPVEGAKVKSVVTMLRENK